MARTQTKRRKSTQFRTPPPGMYNVIMHNDDVTTMDFVVSVLIRIFHKTQPTAERLMLQVHNEGSAVAGTYHKDIAQSKAEYTMSLAKQNGFPLKLTVEEA